MTRIPPALALVCLTGTAVAQSPSCQSTVAGQATTVVELYTSEGCNSCPPADRWVATLPQAGTVVLAFHVDYWDHLGWADRFASPANTRRQAAQRAINGARYSYTPQVVVNGRDRMDWSSMRLPTALAAPIDISLSRSGDRVQAQVRSAVAARLAAYWAVTETGHSTAVRAGENQGETLRHEHVVREWVEVPAWTLAAGASSTLHFEPSRTPDPAHPREVKLVVLDAATGRPVQAAKLGC